MWTRPLMIGIARSVDERVTVPMRYNSSHQAGTRLFVGTLALDESVTQEDTPASFAAHRFFDAMALYRSTIEAEGWRLLHAIARRDV